MEHMRDDFSKDLCLVRVYSNGMTAEFTKGLFNREKCTGMGI
jgi:hypothetical protein